MIEEVKLISRNKNNNPIEDLPFNGFSDIEYDSYGNWVKCSGDEGLFQNFAKAIMTNPFSNYGTFFRRLLGKKNTFFIKVKLLSDISTSLNTLKRIQLEFLNNFPTYNKKLIIGKLYSLLVLRTSPTSLNVDAKLSSLDEEIKNNSQYSELNLRVS